MATSESTCEMNRVSPMAATAPPLTPQRLRDLAQTHFRAGRLNEALECLDLAERDRPASPGALKLRMLVLIKSGRPDEAGMLLPRLLAVKRDDEAWQRSLARMAVRLRDWQVAGDAWSKVRQHDPADEEAMRGLLRVHQARGEHSMVLEAVEALSGTASPPSDLEQARAGAHVGLGQLHRALELVRRLLVADRERTIVWLDGLDGPWWILIKVQALMADELAPDPGARRLRLLAASLARGFDAEIRKDWIAAYAAFRAATIADGANPDASDGLRRIHTQLVPLLSSPGSPQIDVADALGAVFCDDELAAQWEPVLHRLVHESDWPTARRRLSEALPPRLVPAVSAAVGRTALLKFKQGDPDSRHYSELHMAIDGHDLKIKTIDTLLRLKRWWRGDGPVPD